MQQLSCQMIVMFNKQHRVREYYEHCLHLNKLGTTEQQHEPELLSAHTRPEQ